MLFGPAQVVARICELSFARRLHPLWIARFAVAVLEPRLPGCGCADEARTAELESIAVARAARRSGIGRMLMETVRDWSWSEGATELILEVRESSGAVRFYRALKFAETGRRKAYYRDPVEDALTMRVALR